MSAREVLEQTALTTDQQKLETAIGHINSLLDIICGLDEGDECTQLVQRHGIYEDHSTPSPERA